MLRVNNACPNAARNMCIFILEKSGLNMYSKPRLALGSDKEKAVKSIKITAKTGMRTLLANSIPLFIPFAA